MPSRSPVAALAPMGRWLVASGCVACALFVSPGAAGGSGGDPSNGSRSIATNTSGALLGWVNGIACPSRRQCTAVDNRGREMTFKPTSPGDLTPVTLDPLPPGPGGYEGLTGVACPSVSQCTAVDWYGGEVTFNPTSPGTPTPFSLFAGTILWDVACPSTSQCTAVDEDGDELTFDPASPGTWTGARVDPNHGGLEAIACPSAGQCTAVDRTGHEVTFNPTSRGNPTPVILASDRPTFWGVACPSTSQCTAVDGDGDAVTFNPTAPANVMTVAINGGDFPHVACPSTSHCTATEGNLEVAKEVTFDPTSPRRPVPVRLGNLVLNAVACPSASQCTAVEDTRHVVTFNPAKVQCVVPKVKGRSLAAARMDITAALCAVGKVTRARSRKVAKGRVALQAPQAGKHLRVGSRVSLVVSRGR